MRSTKFTRNTAYRVEEIASDAGVGVKLVNWAGRAAHFHRASSDKGATLRQMSVELLVFAPSLEESVVTDLSASLAKHLKVAVSLGGYYGPDGRSPATWIEGLADLIAFIDLNQYW